MQSFLLRKLQQPNCSSDQLECRLVVIWTC